MVQHKVPQILVVLERFLLVVAKQKLFLNYKLKMLPEMRHFLVFLIATPAAQTKHNRRSSSDSSRDIPQDGAIVKRKQKERDYERAKD